MTATLGVSTFQYAPYALLCLISPLIAILYGFTGFKIEKLSQEEIDRLDAEERSMKGAANEDLARTSEAY